MTDPPRQPETVSSEENKSDPSGVIGELNQLKPFLCMWYRGNIS